MRLLGKKTHHIKPIKTQKGVILHILKQIPKKNKKEDGHLHLSYWNKENSKGKEGNPATLPGAGSPLPHQPAFEERLHNCRATQLCLPPATKPPQTTRGVRMLPGLFSVFVSLFFIFIFFFDEFEQIRTDIQSLCMNCFKFQGKQVFRI